LNAANEVAVDAFLDERIPFKLIPALIESVLKKNSSKPVTVLEDVIEADADARESAREWMRSMGYA
jgi:1-deoxy-D-xylulose-5-phosphate reductoisomerase